MSGLPTKQIPVVLTDGVDSNQPPLGTVSNPMITDATGTTVQPVETPVSVTCSSPSATAVSNSSAQILASNPSRIEVLVTNTSTHVIYLGLGQVPTTSAYHVALAACTLANDGTGGSYISDNWKGAINAIASVSGTVVVAELT